MKSAAAAVTSKVRPLFALLALSLRHDNRNVWTHLMRTAMLGTMLVIMLTMTAQMSYIDAPGLVFFSMVVFTSLGVVTLASITLFAGAITEEKEEMTLGMMRMTRLDPLAILLGKVGSRFLSMATLFLLQVPFTLMAVTLGGVSLEQVITCYIALFAFTIALMGIGTLLSVCCMRTRSASGGMFLVLLLWQVGPPIIWGISESLTYRASDSLVSTTAQFISEHSIIPRLVYILSSGFPRNIYQIDIFHFVLGIGLFVLAWLIFRRSAIEPIAPGPARDIGRVSAGAKKRRWRAPSRPWRRPLMWKEFYFSCQGRRGVLALSVIHIGIAIFWMLINDANDFYSYGEQLETLGYQLFFVGLAMVILIMAIGAGRLLNEEISWNTLSSLATLPTTMRRIIFHKVLGTLPLISPSIITMLVGLFLIRHDVEFFDDDLWWVIITVLIEMMVGLPLIFLLSLHIRWGAMGAAMILMIVGNIIVFMLGYLVLYNLMDIDDDVTYWLIECFKLAMIVPIFFAIRRRLPQLVAA